MRIWTDNEYREYLFEAKSLSILKISVIDSTERVLTIRTCCYVIQRAHLIDTENCAIKTVTEGFYHHCISIRLLVC